MENRRIFENKTIEQSNNFNLYDGDDDEKDDEIILNLFTDSSSKSIQNSRVVDINMSNSNRINFFDSQSITRTIYPNIDDTFFSNQRNIHNNFQNSDINLMQKSFAENLNFSQSTEFNLLNSIRNNKSDLISTDNSSNFSECSLHLLKKPTLKIDEPYQYQIDIFQKIKDKNSIVFMETGKGKTFISIMLINFLINNYNPYNKQKNVNKFIDINNFNSKKINEGENQKSSKMRALEMIEYKKKAIPNINLSKKKIVFLVCDVVLVDQQSKVISSNLDNSIKVAAMNGGKKFSRVSSSLDNFKAFWEEYTVFVSTPNIIYKLLSIGYINITLIDLLIFDECHHADGNHPYNLLMNEFYFFHKENEESNKIKLPQILGLTASPLKKKIDKDVNKVGRLALETLCENLDSVMVIDPEVLDFKILNKGDEDDIKMLSQNEAKRTYIEIENHKSSNYFLNLRKYLLNYLLIPLIDLCFKQEILDDQFILLRTPYGEYVENKLDCPNLTEYNKIINKRKEFYEFRKKSGLFAILEKLQTQIFMIVENLDLKCIIKLIENYKEMYDNEFEIRNRNENFQMKNKFVDENNQNLDLDDIKRVSVIFTQFINLIVKSKITYESPRLSMLLENINKIIIDDIKNKTDHRVLIFVGNRIVSELLSKLINDYLNQKFNDVKNNSTKIFQSVSVVGVNKRKNENSFNPSNSLNKMNENVQKFKSGEAQILVGTSTVEEGIDVKSCDHVIVYTDLKTAKSYIQMKGRARKANAVFSIYTNDIKKMQENIKEFVDLIIFIRNQFNKDSIVNDFRNNEMINKKFILNAEESDFYYIANSKAKITINNSAILYNEFIQVLKNKDNSIVVKETFIEERKAYLQEKPIYYKCTFHLHSKKYKMIENINLESNFRPEKKSSLASCYVDLFMMFHQLMICDDYFKIKKLE